MLDTVIDVAQIIFADIILSGDNDGVWSGFGHCFYGVPCHYDYAGDDASSPAVLGRFIFLNLFSVEDVM